MKTRHDDDEETTSRASSIDDSADGSPSFYDRPLLGRECSSAPAGHALHEQVARAGYIQTLTGAGAEAVQTRGKVLFFSFSVCYSRIRIL